MDWGTKLRSGLETSAFPYEKSSNAPPDREASQQVTTPAKISGAEISGNGTVLFPGAMRLSAPAGALKTAYAPDSRRMPSGILFVEALQRISYTEYLLDILLYGEIEEKAALIAAQGKEVLRLEQRISELAAGNAGSGQKDDGHNGTGADTGRNPGNIRGDAERRREEQHPKLPDGVPA